MLGLVSTPLRPEPEQQEHGREGESAAIFRVVAHIGSSCPATTTRFIRVNQRWIDIMIPLAFVAGILLGGKAGLLRALYMNRMGHAAGGS